MATYIISKEITLTRQEGDTGDVVFVVPDVLDLTGFTEIKFQVKTNNGLLKMDKSVSGGTITVNLQTITIPLLVADTKGKEGQFRWELQISNTTEVVTIGRGTFYIVCELIL